MHTIEQTAEFKKWFASLKDMRAQTRIHARIEQVAAGNMGDTEPVGHRVHELRIHYGPGYRLYFTNTAKRSSSCCAGATRAPSNKT
jgi:putative addiction module killer protein